MNILVISCSPWREDNNIGNSYTNIFKGIENIEMAHICCGSGIPNTNFVKKHFHISEKNIINNLLDKNKPCGHEYTEEISRDLLPIGSRSGLFDFMRKYRSQIFFWIRDIIWCFKNWKNYDLKKFIDNFQPDMIFAPFLATSYMNEMLLFVKKYTNKPLVLYAWDDVYSLKQFSLSPLFWINKFIQRYKLKKVSNISSQIYCISNNQCIEYSKLLHKSCKILWKGINITDTEEKIATLCKPLSLVYTGNISSGRWKTLAMIGQALEEINKDSIKAKLYIYTATPMTKSMKKSLDLPNSINLEGYVPSNEIPEIQANADMLIHVESFSLKEKLQVRLSFSTKIVDYLAKAKCIFAVGPSGVASIDYLLANDAALVATNKKEIVDKLTQAINNNEILCEYQKKSWECGKRNHDKKTIQSNLIKDFEEVKKSENSSN